MPRCGNCKEVHVSVADVRACYENDGLNTVARSASDITGPMWPASSKQIDYACGLQEERNLPDGYVVKDKSELAKMERDEVSNLIGLLKTFSRKEGVTTRKQYEMPSGRFALWHEDLDAWWFFQVDKPDNGRWAGYTFIKRLVATGGHEYQKIDLRASERAGWLDAIEKDPQKAMRDYGLQTGRCGHCGRVLSDPESLARGIGPICSGKMGW